MDQETLYQKNIDLLRRAGIPYREVEHDPVLDYETAAEVRQHFGLTGIESKSVFLKLKDGRHCMFITLEGQRFNAKRIKRLLSSKPSICSSEELVENTGCAPGCACPFGHPQEIILVVDRAVFQPDKILYSPGPPEKTVEISTRQIQVLLDQCDNQVVFYTHQDT